MILVGMVRKLISVESQKDPKVQELLEREARHFMIAGGSFTSGEWALMSQIERNCAVRAGERLAIEQAIMVGAASRSKAEATRVMSAIDGGDAELGMILQGAVQSAIKDLELKGRRAG